MPLSQDLEHQIVEYSSKTFLIDLGNSVALCISKIQAATFTP